MTFLLVIVFVGMKWQVGNKTLEALDLVEGSRQDDWNRELCTGI